MIFTNLKVNLLRWQHECMANKSQSFSYTNFVKFSEDFRRIYFYYYKLDLIIKKTKQFLTVFILNTYDQRASKLMYKISNVSPFINIISFDNIHHDFSFFQSQDMKLENIH